MDDMVERVAMAIWLSEPKRIGSRRLTEWEDESEETHSRYRPSARAAIAAMREPTEAMKDEARDAPEDWEDVTATWQAMIDAALAKAPSPTS